MSSVVFDQVILWHDVFEVCFALARFDGSEPVRGHYALVRNCSHNDLLQVIIFRL